MKMTKKYDEYLTTRIDKAMEKYVCTECGGDATIAMTGWEDVRSKKQYYKKGERLCLRCHKIRTGISIF